MPISRGKKQANPFDSDSDSEISKPAARSSSVPNFQNQSVQELETYAVNKSKETTDKVNDCLKIAEVIREDANRTLVTIHQQGEQIHRTHQQAADIDHDLSRSEKLLNSLGGLFSKPWKPKKTREIKGPDESMIDDRLKKKVNHKEQRDKLGLTSGQHSNPRKYAEPSGAMETVQVEKEKQDDTLSDLSNVLGELKGMALDMGTEIEKQNKALDAMGDDVEELNYRVKGANQRGRKLLGK